MSLTRNNMRLLTLLLKKIGLLFQIVDDIIDVTEHIKYLGKTANKDSEQDKDNLCQHSLEIAQQTAKNFHLEVIELLKIRQFTAKILADSVYYRNS